MGVLVNKAFPIVYKALAITVTASLPLIVEVSYSYLFWHHHGHYALSRAQFELITH
jgi:hypothetical protein